MLKNWDSNLGLQEKDVEFMTYTLQCEFLTRMIEDQGVKVQNRQEAVILDSSCAISCSQGSKPHAVSW